MNFNLVIGTNPRPAWDSIGDMVLILQRALEACGHRVLVSDSFVMAGAVNVFFDRIHYYPDLIRDLVARKVVYGIVFTELLDGQGRINWGYEEAETENLRPGLEEASFVWCLLEDSVAAVRAYNPRTYYLPYGYADGIQTIVRLPREIRDIDFVVTGIITPRRTAALAKLGERGFRTHSSHQAPTYVRDGLLARSHVNLSVNKFDGHNIVSVTRVCHSVINKVPIVLEVMDTPGEYAKYCVACTADTIVETAADFYRNTDVDDFAEEMFRKFKAERNMTDTMRDLISRIPMRQTATSVHVA